MTTRSRSLHLIPVRPLTEAQSAAMMRRIAAAKKRGGGIEDPDIPAVVPAGAAIILGPARGRPRSTPEGTQQVTLRLPKQVLAYFKRGGRGWQTRAVAALTHAMEHSGKSVR